MSSIASFHIIPLGKESSLLAASEVVRNTTTKGFLFFKKESVETVDELWNFLNEFGQKQPAFEFSGYAFNSLELLLEDQKVGLYQYEKQPTSDAFRNGRDDFGSIFDASGAKQTLSALKGANLSDSAIQEFMQQEYPEEDLADGIEAVRAAADIFERWLEAVQENEIGLLIF
ncbi:MAG: hypothetical protein ABJM43_11775 [Paracoccaceae bacterium]